MYIVYFTGNEWFAQQPEGDITGTNAQNLIIELLYQEVPAILMNNLDELKNIPGLEDVEPTLL